MSARNGGPAFPIPETEYRVGNEGMTLRDYFAGEELSKVQGTAICDEQAAYDRLATHCYRMADAMLRARGASWPA